MVLLRESGLLKAIEWPQRLQHAVAPVGSGGIRCKRSQLRQATIFSPEDDILYLKHFTPIGGMSDYKKCTSPIRFRTLILSIGESSSILTLT